MSTQQIAVLKNNNLDRTYNYLNVNNSNLLNPNFKSKDKKRCKNPKKLSRRLEEIITIVYKTKFEEKKQQNSILQQNRENILKILLEKYSQYQPMIKDGNSVYRILGMHHLWYLSKNKEELNNFYDMISNDSFEVFLISKVPKKYEQLLKKHKLIESIKMFMSFLGKKQDKIQKVLNKITNLLNQNDILDFHIVVLYRLIIYYEGYKKYFLEYSHMFSGNQNQDILVYSNQTTPIIIKLASEVFHCKINIFLVDGLELEYTIFNRDLGNAKQENVLFQIDMLFVDKHYCLLQQKSTVIQIEPSIEKHSQYQDFTQKLDSPSCISDKIDVQSGIFSIVKFVQQVTETQNKFRINKTIELTIQNESNKPKITQRQSLVNSKLIQSSQKRQVNSPMRESRKVGSIRKQNPENDKILQGYYSSFLEIKNTQKNLYDKIYNKLTQQQKFKIVLPYIKSVFQSKDLNSKNQKSPNKKQYQSIQKISFVSTNQNSKSIIPEGKHSFSNDYRICLTQRK